jgi:hypothetical protein
MKTRFLLATGLAIALTGAGCGGSAPTPTPAATNSVPPNNNQPLQPTGEQASAGIPQYPGSSLISKNEQEKVTVNAFSSEDDAATVQAWYAQQLPTIGYAAKGESSVGANMSKAYVTAEYQLTVNTIDQGSQHPKTLFSVTRTAIEQP